MREQHRLGRLDRVWPGITAAAWARARRTSARSKSSSRASSSPMRRRSHRPEIRRHLIVPGAGGVEGARDRTDPREERHLEVHVDVLELRVPRERVGQDLRLEAGAARPPGCPPHRRSAARPAPARGRGRWSPRCHRGPARHPPRWSGPKSAASASGASLKRPPHAFMAGSQWSRGSR